MVSEECCEGVFPDTVCWTRLGNMWNTFVSKMFTLRAYARLLLEQKNLERGIRVMIQGAPSTG